MRGRKPTLKTIEGGLSGTLPVPSWLPAEAAAEWRRIAPGLVERRALAADMLAMLESYVLHIGLVRRAWDAIEAEGEYAGGKRHPGFTTIAQSGAEARRLAAELGLTPASRSKIGAPKAEDTDDDLDLG